MAFFDTKTSPSQSAVLGKPRMDSAPKKLKPCVDVGVLNEDAIAEYRKVAASIGVSEQDILVEEFRLFLSKHDIPTFNHQIVVSYMDELVVKDNPTGLGWQWCPVRAKDGLIAMTFGRPSEDKHSGQFNGSSDRKITPSSDYYASHRFAAWHGIGQRWQGGSTGFNQSSANQTNVHVESNVRLMQAAHDEMFQHPPQRVDWRTMPSPVYTRTLPLHALKKIALVEKHFTATQVVFLVTDYVVAPHVIINPDPFLMAVIPNSAVSHGKGRFIIDVWDEPGFGIDQMVK